MTQERDILFLINSFGRGTYSRFESLRKLHPTWSIDRVFLDRPIYLTFDPDPSILQNNRQHQLSRYKLIIYWPSSYQYRRARLGSAFFYGNEDEFIQRGWMVAEMAVFEGYESRMLNPYAASQLAANKICLFRSANAIKCSFPNTLITNDVQATSKFRKKNLILKTVTDTPDINERSKVFPVQASLPVDKTLLSAQPIIFQEEIASDFEFRTYYFGGNIVTLEIARRPGELDVRLRPGRFLRGRIIKNAAITSKMHRIAKNFKLAMFAADFLIDRHGKLYLLDVNPHGSWHWIEQKIRKSLDCAFSRMIAARLNR